MAVPCDSCDPVVPGSAFRVLGSCSGFGSEFSVQSSVPRSGAGAEPSRPGIGSDCSSGRDLRSTTAQAELVQRLGERQVRLRGVPAAREPVGNRLPAVDFHPEALEAQRARAIRSIGFAEAIPRFFPPARHARLDNGSVGER